MPTNWMTVGDAITKRLDEIGKKQKDLADESNVGAATIREIQRGKERRRNPRILQALSKALGWPANHLEDILQGRQPSQQPPADRPSHEERAALPADPQSAFLAKLAYVLEHRIGPVVDVIYNNDSAVDITIEIRHPPHEQ